MRKIIAAFFFLYIGVYLQAQNLSWDIKFLKGTAQESVPISRQIRMETGETFLITIKPETDCFCYVVFYDSAHEIFVMRDAPITGRVEVNVGPFVLEAPPGIETFYVIISINRQTELEKLIQAYNSNSNSRQNANNLYREVVNLQTTVSNLGEPASSFIASGGTTRSGPADSIQQTQVTRFSGKAMYVRAITIRH
jgi:hypothetical protein